MSQTIGEHMDKLIRIKDISTIRKGKTCNISESGEPYLSLNFIRNNESPLFTNDHGTWVQKGSILIVLSGGNSGEILTAPIDAYIPATIGHIKFNEKKINGDFLFHVLNQNEQNFRHLSKTSNFHFNLDFSDFFNTTLKLPSMENQIKIGSLFANNLLLKEEIKKECEKYKLLINEYKVSYISSLFERADSNNNCRIKDISKSKVSLLPKEHSNGKEYNYISATNIDSGSIKSHQTIIVDKKSTPNLLNKNDIVVSMVGNNAGKSALIRDEKLIPSQSLCSITSKEYLPIYLYLNYVKKDWEIYSKGTGFKSINNSVIKNQVIPSIKDKIKLRKAEKQIKTIEQMEKLIYNINLLL